MGYGGCEPIFLGGSDRGGGGGVRLGGQVGGVRVDVNKELKFLRWVGGQGFRLVGGGRVDVNAMFGVGGDVGYGGCEPRIDGQGTMYNKQIQKIYVPRQDFFLRNMESSENGKFIGGFIHTRYILSTYVDSINS